MKCQCKTNEVFAHIQQQSMGNKGQNPTPFFSSSDRGSANKKIVIFKT